MKLNQLNSLDLESNNKILNSISCLKENLNKIDDKILSLNSTSLKLLRLSNNFKFPKSYFEEREERRIKQSRNLNCVLPSDRENNLLKETSLLIVSLVPLSELVVRGTLLRAVKRWQLNHNKAIRLLDKMDYNSQIRAWVEILTEATRILGNMIRICDHQLKITFIQEIFRLSIECVDELIFFDLTIN